MEPLRLLKVVHDAINPHCNNDFALALEWTTYLKDTEIELRPTPEAVLAMAVKFSIYIQIRLQASLASGAPTGRINHNRAAAEEMEDPPC